MKRFLTQHIYCLTPLKLDVKTDTADGQPLDLLSFLQEQTVDEVDVPIQFGERDRFACRLWGQRVRHDVAEARRARLREQDQDKGHAPSQQALALADWTLLVTTVPPTLFAVGEAMIWYRVRWQIELIFKLWKSLFFVDEWRSDNPWRILCEMMAKLVVVIVQHWIFLTTCWQYADKSLFKAAVTIQKFAFALARVFPSHERLCEGVVRYHTLSGFELSRPKTQEQTSDLSTVAEYLVAAWF